MSQTSVHVRIRGRVQGVWYRGWTVKHATDRNLSGWVRNRSDGSVEAVFVGSKPQINEMIQECYRGPTAASVEHIDVKYKRISVKPEFVQLPTL